MALRIVPIDFASANEFIRRHHRHHRPSVGTKFCVAVEAGGEIVGVATVGRPVNRNMDNGFTLEVNRSCTDGTKNANSMLYAAAQRIAKEMGYRRIITYTLDSECGSSLKAVGWKQAATVKAEAWDYNGKPRANDWPIAPKIRWEAELT